MTLPEQRITDFIGEHHILTLANSHNHIPWCANRFIITSDHHTRHIREVVEGNNYRVAGAIALETKLVGKIRGIQFSGLLLPLSGEDQKKAKSAYLKRFPIARLMPDLHLWAIAPDYIKMTDNRLGFGKKLAWTPEESPK